MLNGLSGFIGHEKLKGHNLIHMNGRIYSPAYARFISADIGVPYPDDWYSYNRYMYVGGNPASRFDPSGFTDRDVHPQQFERMPWESQQGQIQQQVDLQIPANFSLQQYMDVSLSSMSAYSPQLGAAVNLMQYQAVDAQLGYYSNSSKENLSYIIGLEIYQYLENNVPFNPAKLATGS